MAEQVKPYRPDPTILAREAFYAPWTPTEAEFTELFLEVAELKGWPADLRYHTHDSRRSPKGFPDWVLVHPGQRRTLFVELKGFAGEPSPEQEQWLAALDAAGQEAYLVKTSNDYAQDAAALGELLSRRPRREDVERRAR